MKEFQKSIIKDYNSPSNKLLIVLDYWSNKIEEDFHLCNSDCIKLSEKSTTQNVTNVLNIMVKHVKSMEQGMIELQEKFIESGNERVKQSISIFEKNFQLKKLHILLYLLNYVSERVKKHHKIPQDVEVY